MTNFINDKALPVTFWQKSSNGLWSDYSIPVYITKDISTVEGIREIVVQFMTEPSEIGYYPRQNDILVPASISETTVSNGLSWTTPYFMEEFLDNPYLANGVLFLKNIEDDKYKFAPIVNLDESVMFLAGNYTLENVLSNCIKNVWDRLVSGHPFFMQYGYGSTYMPVKYKTSTYEYYDNPTTVTLSDIFEKFVSRLPRDFDITLQTYRGYQNAIIMNVILRNGSSNFSIAVTSEKLVGYSKRSRSKSEGTNLVYGYNQKTGAFYNYAWLDKNGNLQTGSTYPQANTPRLDYCELDGDNPTVGELRTRASSMLKGSILGEYDELDLEIDMSNRYVYGTRTNPALNYTPDSGAQQIYLNTVVNVIGMNDNNINLEVREMDLLNGHLIIGKNDDITLGD